MLHPGYAMLVILGLLMTGNVCAESFQYFYDETGQLIKAVDSHGNVVEYIYDEVGNTLEVKRSKADGLGIFNFSPSRGPETTVVILQGQHFSSNLGGNTVKFNGVSAEVTAQSETALTAIVPPGASTGPISVTVGTETATSEQHFTVTQEPLITSIHPNVFLTNSQISSVTVNGVNLTGSSFSVAPVLSPAAVAVESATINSAGTTATLNLKTGSQSGQFTLIAASAAGTSNTFSVPGNSISLVDANADTDSDGDGFPDGLEGALGSDPYNAASQPTPDRFVTEIITAPFSVLNTVDPAQIAPLDTMEVASPPFSINNAVNPGLVFPPSSEEVVSPNFSIHNQIP